MPEAIQIVTGSGGGGTFEKYPFEFDAADFSSDGPETETSSITVSASIHRKGTNPSFQSFELIGSDYVENTNEEDIFFNSLGDITLQVTSGEEFNGRLTIF